MPSSEAQKKALRRLGHSLKPVVMVGENGVTPGVLAELESALAHHELLKVRIRAGDRDQRAAIITQLCDTTAAELVQRVGNMALLFRRNPDDPKIALPGA